MIAPRVPGGPSPQNWKLTRAYDGGPFYGWQVQPDRRTVQGTLAAAVERVTGEAVLPQGSGRTDTGVHALGQVASCSLLAPIPAPNLQRALNRTLPGAMRVLAAEHAPPGFHARHSALSKLYEYRIFRGELCPPTLAPYVHACPWPLDLDSMQQAAALVLGEHDFASFAAREPDLSSRAAPPGSTAPAGPRPTTRTLLHSAWTVEAGTEAPGQLLIYRVRGTGFLHHMVRNLVGTFLAVGRRQFTPAEMSAILAAKDRSAAGPTAPACGLFLHSVAYRDAEPAGAGPPRPTGDAVLP